MNEPGTRFKYLGHGVAVDAVQHHGQWFWSYTIDGGEPIELGRAGMWSRQSALDEGGMEARDAVRDLAHPIWRSNS